MKLKSSAVAHPNIALIKYWGRSLKHDWQLNLPLNDTVSMTKQGVSHEQNLSTRTTIEFSDDYSADRAFLHGVELTGRAIERILRVVNPLRALANLDLKFRMMSVNDFPTQAGLASSASAFAALAMATADALQLNLSGEELSKIARLGSGSAARSIHGGFVYLHRGQAHETAYAEQICEPTCFAMRAVIVIVDDSPKKITSDVGHQLSHTSPFDEIRIAKSQQQAAQIRSAILNDDFGTVGKIAEANCLYMHAVMITSEPALFYWSPATFRVIQAIQQLRQDGLECYFTIDAGPNVHCLCRPTDMAEIQEALTQIEGVKKTILVEPGSASYAMEDDLF